MENWQGACALPCLAARIPAEPAAVLPPPGFYLAKDRRRKLPSEILVDVGRGAEKRQILAAKWEFKHETTTSKNLQTASQQPSKGPNVKRLAFHMVAPIPPAKKLDHGWPESRKSQARSAQRCIPTRSICEASARQHQARCSAQTGWCKLVCASCSTQVALCKLLCASCSAQVAPASWSLQVAPCKLLCANCAPCKLLCASCSVQVALRKLLCVSCSAQVALGKALCANWSVQVGLRKLLCATCSAQVALRKLL